MTHHPFSPSILNLRDLCPASYRAEQNLPDVPSSDADEGTRLHAKVAEHITCHEWESDNPAVQYCLDAVKALVGNVSCKAQAERYVEYKKDGNIVYYGTCDLIVTVGNEVHVYDWKFGYADVTEAQNNLQLAGYALAIMQMFNVKKVVVHLVCPRLRKISTYTHKSAKVIDNIISEIIERCMSCTAEYRPNDYACRYCKANLHGTCPAIRKAMNALSVQAEKPAELLAKADDETICRLYRQSQQVEKLQIAVKEELQKRIREDGSCGDYTERLTSGGYSVHVNGLLLTELVNHGIPEQDAMEALSASYTALFDLYCKANETPSTTKKELKNDFENIFEDWLVLRPMKRTIVKMTKEV